MKKRLEKLTVAGISLAMTLMSLAGCGEANSQTTTQTTTQTTVKEESTAQVAAPATQTKEEVKLSGTISLAGSTSMEKMCEALSESFMEKYPDITVTVEYTGSGAGLEALAAGSTDIGDASRHLKDSEKEAGAVENVVALDGIAVIVDKANAVTDLTTEQLTQIYTGALTNWKELGGADEAIVVIGREAGSGTRDAFEELMKVKDTCTYAQELDSTGGVLAKVQATPGAIGYVSLDVVNDSVTAVALNGVQATEENILAGTYALQRPFVMATMGEISGQNELVQEWFQFISSDEGKEIIKKIGLIIPQ